MTGSGSWTPPPPVLGPIPLGDIPAQPEFPAAFCVAWNAFDVPRMADILAAEASLDNAAHKGWVQVQGLAQLSDLLWQQHRNLGSRCGELGEAWQSPAGREILSRVEAFAQMLLSDANCASTTAGALHNILTSFGEAKVKMHRLHERWNGVTNDLVPEWWDEAAEELNVEARTIMLATDEAVKDYRKNILIPRAHLPGKYLPPEPPPDEPISTDLGGIATSARIPPVPGYDPVAGSGLSEAELAGIPGAPSMIPAVPGTPVSMLPIPPGSQYAPYGGAYILPGPGVGKGGYVVPMPRPGGPAGGIGRVGGVPGGLVAGRSGAPGGMSMMPMPMGSPMPGSAGAGGGLYRRPDTVWRTEKGVPPVIDGIADDELIPDQPSEKQQVAFKDWFADLAYPWRSEDQGPQPQVMFRKAAE